MDIRICFELFKRIIPSLFSCVSGVKKECRGSYMTNESWENSLKEVLKHFKQIIWLDEQDEAFGSPSYTAAWDNPTDPPRPNFITYIALPKARNEVYAIPLTRTKKDVEKYRRPGKRKNPWHLTRK